MATKDPATGAVSEVQQTHYYPFGGIIADISSGRSMQNRLYNGKELDTSNNLWWYDYGARQYDPTAPRFNRPDRFSEKYYSLNMYGYCGYNPVNKIDINGDSIAMNYFVEMDKVLSSNVTKCLLDDWQLMTGLSLYFSESGQLNYEKDTKGNPVIATKLNKKGKQEKNGSEVARKFLMDVINDKETINFVGGASTSTVTDSNIIGVNFNQITGLIKGTSDGLDSRTLGWGMTIMHEMKHTNVGGALKDDGTTTWSRGPVVNFMNKVRKQLDKQGYSFGKRLQYQAFPAENGYKILFNKQRFIKF